MINWGSGIIKDYVCDAMMHGGDRVINNVDNTGYGTNLVADTTVTNNWWTMRGARRRLR